jgi:hypothetical protein
VRCGGKVAAGVGGECDAGDGDAECRAKLSVPAVRHYLQQGESRFHAALVEDGLPPRIARLIIAATEGAEQVEMFERPDTEGLQLLERDLLALTRVAPAVTTILDVVTAAPREQLSVPAFNPETPALVGVHQLPQPSGGVTVESTTAQYSRSSRHNPFSAKTSVNDPGSVTSAPLLRRVAHHSAAWSPWTTGLPYRSSMLD